jgi:NAD(P)H-hydrate epimerase
MNELLRVPEMYRADALAIEGGIPGIDLMERAGAGIADAIRARWSPRPVGILCGPGNNGGDGFVVARLLAEDGWPVRLSLLGDRAKLKGDAAVAAERWTGPIVEDALEGAGLIVDALFGAGLARPLDGAAKALVERVNASGLPVVAVDVPSGVNGDTGLADGTAVKADVSVTFFRRKPGHLLMPGRRLAGEVVVADIGIPASVLGVIRPQGRANAAPLLPDLQAEGHKYARGHAVVVAGNAAGAARLAAMAALRAGAGLVTVAGPALTVTTLSASLTSVMTKTVQGTPGLTALLSDRRLNAVLLGPEIGRAHV